MAFHGLFGLELFPGRAKAVEPITYAELPSHQSLAGWDIMRICNAPFREDVKDLSEAGWVVQGKLISSSSFRTMLGAGVMVWQTGTGRS